MGIKPAEIVGCTSDGQLIWLALPAAEDLGISIRVLGTSVQSSVFQLMDWWWRKEVGVILPNKDWKNSASLEFFADSVNADGRSNPVTTEWENVPLETLSQLEEYGLTLRPGYHFLEEIQDRVTEKELAKKLSVEPVPYMSVSSLADLRNAINTHGLPAIIKTRGWGYDGKWQWRIQEKDDIELFWKEHFSHTSVNLIFEKMIDLDYELSVIGVVDGHKNIELLWPMYNIHEEGILRYSIDPAPISEDIKNVVLWQAQKIMERAKEYPEWWYIGILTMEFFIDTSGKIYLNEFAPRPHNSGHASLDSRTINQNHLWLGAVSGRSIEKTRIKKPVIMQNILSEKELHRMNYFWWSSWANIYDYKKLSHPPDPDNTTQRKLGHINHFWNRIEKMLCEVERGNMTIHQVVQALK